MIKKILISVIFAIGLFFVGTASVTAQVTKEIRVNLTEQRLYAYEHGELIYNFPVSTGTLSTPTPTGGFWPWIKLRYDGMQGGSRARGDYYNLPNVPYVVYFYNENYPKWMGYALHGTYWHNNFGTPMSHGCINLRTEDMAQLYPWIDVPTANQTGTIIIIEGETPQ